MPAEVADWVRPFAVRIQVSLPVNKKLGMTECDCIPSTMGSEETRNAGFSWLSV